MSLDFLRDIGARRLSRAPDQPVLTRAELSDDEEPGESVDDLHYEMKGMSWRPIDCTGHVPEADEIPRRFIDGCYRGETVAWVQTPEGHPVPIRLAEVGGICLRDVDRTLTREAAPTRRLVAMIADPFSWDRIEGFASALAEHDFRLLPVRPPIVDAETGRRAAVFDFELMHRQTRNALLPAMDVLEEEALRHSFDAPSLVDGRIGRFHWPDLPSDNLIGVIKRQQEDYLHPDGWRVVYQLEPGQRTPAFRLASHNTPALSWYLKLSGGDGSMPQWGVVRVEIPLARFERLGRGFDQLNRISRAIFDRRCRQNNYARAAVSLEPIVQAEERLKPLFSPFYNLTQRFYRLTNL
ncbi:hypothetical protein [Zavarzinella formosa]|uniref:hypothetical protein n=1 Tax=Zavarzinella formosa TaxID=360055 RepID=UPI00031AC0EE|nr:hypothetical protein [Zavarzinella formosa]